MTKPWISDIQLDEDMVRTFLAAHHPDLALHSIRKLDEGWDNELYLVGEDLLFRFTRRRFVIPFAVTEIKVLSLLDGLCTIPIPRIIHSGLLNGVFPYFSYRMLPGAIAANLGLTPAERRPLARPLADLLNGLHAIPLSDTLRAVLPGDSIGRMDIAKRLGQIRAKLPVIDQLAPGHESAAPRRERPAPGEDLTATTVELAAIREELSAVTEELAAAVSQQDVEQIRCLVHGDLYSRNLLISDRRQLSGLIDWTDVHLGHPAKDLSFAVSYFDPGSFAIVKEHYRSCDQRTFLLSILSALNHTCHLAEYAVDINDAPLISECRVAFSNILANYTAYK